ncbi:MAG: hypothetical protein SFU85_09715 [Candidatus Methylacidiphilales bacterium]|nr:hypothetical protein [Candidatus Methylacidiphilales bacterium]
MIYPVSLGLAAVVAGLLLLVSHLPVLFLPSKAPHLLASLPRHRILGWVLLALATLWFATLLGRIDLMEYTPHRLKFVLAVLVVGGLSAVYLEDFLAARALGALLLLAAQVLLDAAFLRDETSRLAVTCTAYAWIIAGMLLVGMPYLSRDVLAWLNDRPPRLTLAASLGAAWGLVLLVLGLAVYRL